MPMSRRFGGVRVRSVPSTTIVPEVGWSKPATSRSAVVLPQPDGPRSDTNSPCSRCKVDPVERDHGAEDPSQAVELEEGHQRGPPSSEAPGAPASDQQEREHRSPGDGEAEQRHGGRRIRLRLLDCTRCRSGRCWKAARLAIVNSPITIASARKRAAERRDPDVREDHRSHRPQPARAEAVRRLRERVHVDRAEAGVEREEHVRERQDHIGAHEETVRLVVEPARRAAEESSRPTTSTIGGTTNGSSARNAITGRNRGSLRCTQ